MLDKLKVERSNFQRSLVVKLAQRRCKKYGNHPLFLRANTDLGKLTGSDSLLSLGMTNKTDITQQSWFKKDEIGTDGVPKILSLPCFKHTLPVKCLNLDCKICHHLYMHASATITTQSGDKITLHNTKFNCKSQNLVYFVFDPNHKNLILVVGRTNHFIQQTLQERIFDLNSRYRRGKSKLHDKC